MRIQAISVCGFLFKANKLLIAKRAVNEDFMPDQWELIGGGVDFGENPRDALIREFLEEFKLDVLPLFPYYSFSYRHRVGDIDQHEIEIDYLVKLKNSNDVPMINLSTHSAYKWIEESEAEEMFANNHPGNQYEAVVEGFGLINKYHL